MKIRDHSLLLSLCASLIVHGALISAIVYLAPASPWNFSTSTTLNYSPVYIPAPAHPDDQIGLQDATGYAANFSPGDQPQHAQQGTEDQAWASKDPQGYTTPGQNPGPNQSIPDENTADTPPAPQTPFGLPNPQTLGQPAIPLASSNKPNEPNSTATTPTPAQPPAAQLLTAGANKANSPAAFSTSSLPSSFILHPSSFLHPPTAGAPDTGTEVDPFAKIGSAEFNAGRVDARFGRQVKATRPRLSLAARVDVMRLGSPTVILKVNINDEGDVTNVDILKTSGSNEIDLACQNALYNWWIEPPKDRSGKPTGDVMVWHITYHS